MTEEDLIKVGVFGFVVARSKESGSIYTLTIVNGDYKADVYDQLTNPTDEITGLLLVMLLMKKSTMLWVEHILHVMIYFILNIPVKRLRI